MQAKKTQLVRRQPKPHYKASHRAWYLNFNGKQIRLASEEEGKEKAMDVYYQVMAGRLPLFKFLQGGAVRIECAFPAGIVAATAENLLAAADGEHEEWCTLYANFATVAREEGFKAIGTIFEMISVAERQHERRYRGFLENLRNGRVFKRSQPVKWRCLNCGFVHEGLEAPAACPACAHPQAYFELLGENW